MLFINPGVYPESQPVVFRPFTYASFPTAIGYLATTIREKHQIPIDIIDEQIDWLDDVKLEAALAKLEEPKLVGISCLTVTAKRTYDISRKIKALDPSITVVVGGVHATAMPEETLTKTQADVVVIGEGELTLCDIYQALLDKTGFDQIAGVALLKEGKLHKTTPRPLLMDITEIPPFPYDLFEKNIDRYRDFGTIISSRGCPFRCTFCSQRIISGQRYRFLPNDRVLAKLDLLINKYGQKKIFFTDDVFTINKKRTFSLLDDIMAAGYHKKAHFIVESRGREITEEMVARLKEANFVSIAFGFETGSERVMQTLQKGEKVAHNLEAVETCHKGGVGSDASLIMGFPTETREEMRISAKIVHQIPLDGARFNIAIPYPGTQFYEEENAKGKVINKGDWVNFSNQHYLMSDDIPYAPDGMSRSELVYRVFVANLKYTLRFKNIMNLLFRPFMAGGTVLSMKKNWFLKPSVWWDIGILLAFLSKRYVQIIVKGGILPALKRALVPQKEAASLPNQGE